MIKNLFCRKKKKVVSVKGYSDVDSLFVLLIISRINLCIFEKDLFELHWSEDSIYIYGENFDEIGLNKLFYLALPDFDFCGDIEVNVNAWNELYIESRKMDEKK